MTLLCLMHHQIKIQPNNAHTVCVHPQNNIGTVLYVYSLKTDLLDQFLLFLLQLNSSFSILSLVVNLYLHKCMHMEMNSCFTHVQDMYVCLPI